MLANYSESTRCFPISRTRFALQRSHSRPITSRVGNSATPYRDELFGTDFATQRVHQRAGPQSRPSRSAGAGRRQFTSRRASDEATNEFLASSDNWFRPTMLKTGPDGALYIADMYRLVIEHPEWIPKEMQARLDLRAGADKGRIYRVHPEGAMLRKIPNLARMSSVELAAALDSPNGWQRDTAQRLLLERGDNSVSFVLEQQYARVREG